MYSTVHCVQYSTVRKRIAIIKSDRHGSMDRKMYSQYHHITSIYSTVLAFILPMKQDKKYKDGAHGSGLTSTQQ